MYIGLQVKYPSFLPDFNENWYLFTYIQKMLKYQILSKSIQWDPSCHMYMGRQTDRQTERHGKANSHCL